MIALKYDSGEAVAESARASDRDGGSAQHDDRLLDLKIYLEAKRLGIGWLKEDLHLPLSK